MSRLGFGLGLDVAKVVASGGGALGVNAYFVCSKSDNEVYKILPDGTTTVFHDYAGEGTDEPYGVAVDSKNGRLFVILGDTTNEYEVHRYDDLTIDTGATATKKLSGYGTFWGGPSNYVDVTDEVLWTSKGTGTKGVLKVDGDLTTVAGVYTNWNFSGVDYWAPDGVAYGSEISSGDSVWKGNLDGTGWTQIAGIGGGLNGMCIPPAHQMGSTEYLLMSDNITDSIRRITRAGAGTIDWLVMSSGGSTIKIEPTAVQYDYSNNEVVFLGFEAGGTGVDGLYKIPIQEAAQSEGNIVLIKDLTSLFVFGNSPTAGHDVSIWYNQDPEPSRIDVL